MNLFHHFTIFNVSIVGHKLEVQIEKSEGNAKKIDGNRIVDISYFLEETLRVQYQHTRKLC